MPISESNIRKVVPYVPGEQPQTDNKVKLNTNENPYPPAPGVIKAMRDISEDKLRLYPDPTMSGLVDALAEFYEVSPDQVFVGVGSDDVLAMCFLTFFNSGKPILFPNITYSFYKVWAELYKIPYRTPALAEDFRINPEDYRAENGGVIFPNPNAPTGRYESLDVVEDMIRSNPDVPVIVDEAYIDFAEPGSSALPLLAKYDNLVVTRTFSKSRSMAGMRIGFAIASPYLIKCLNDVKYSFNSYTLNLPSIICGIEAVRDKAYFERRLNEIKTTRNRAADEFRKLGFVFADSSANFIFVRHPERSAKEIFDFLRARNVFVRYLGLEGAEEYLRVTIGTDEEMGCLFKWLREFLQTE